MEQRQKFQLDPVECPEHVEGQTLVYILECTNGSLYVGSTTNLQERLKAHATGHASLWTKRFAPFQLVYCKTYMTHLEATRREQQVKRWSRIKKLQLIRGIWK